MKVREYTNGMKAASFKQRRAIGWKVAPTLKRIGGALDVHGLPFTMGEVDAIFQCFSAKTKGYKAQRGDGADMVRRLLAFQEVWRQTERINPIRAAYSVHLDTLDDGEMYYNDAEAEADFDRAFNDVFDQRPDVSFDDVKVCKAIIETTGLVCRDDEEKFFALQYLAFIVDENSPPAPINIKGRGQSIRNAVHKVLGLPKDTKIIGAPVVKTWGARDIGNEGADAIGEYDDTLRDDTTIPDNFRANAGVPF